MTQQPAYYPPPAPPAPQQPYPQQGYPAPAPQPAYPPQYPQAPGPGYAQPAPQQYAPQAYAPPAPQAPQQPPLATGSLDAYYAQPSAATGPSISWTNADRSPKPIGTAYAGIVTRDVTNADVQQQTDFNTKAPLFYRDGRPKFAMKVPLRVQPSAEFPEGEATWYVKGQARDELVRAMAEAGETGAPKAGATIVVTLVQRRNSGAGLNPANVVQVQYRPADGTGAPSPAPAPQQVAQTPQGPLPPLPETAYAPTAQPIPPAAPMPPAPPAAPVQQQGPPPPAPPTGLNEQQAALLAQLTGQQG